MAVAVDRIARQAAHLEDLAALLARFPSSRNSADMRPISFWSSLTIITLSVSRTLSNGTTTTLFLSARRMMRSKPSGATAMVTMASIALVDEVLDRAELRGDVGAGGDDLELLDVLLDARLLGEGLGGLDHLDAPGVADEAVDQRDPVGAGLLVPLEELGLVRPGLEALADRRRGRKRLRACPCGRRHQETRERQRGQAANIFHSRSSLF